MSRNPNAAPDDGRAIAIFRSLADVPSGFGPTVAAVGNFDGVHLGHREILAAVVDEARQQLLEWDRRQAEIVEMRYFGGLTEDEVAAVLGISSRTVKRDWGMARDWLAIRLAGT